MKNNCQVFGYHPSRHRPKNPKSKNQIQLYFVQCRNNHSRQKIWSMSNSHWFMIQMTKNLSLSKKIGTCAPLHMTFWAIPYHVRFCGQRKCRFLLYHWASMGFEICISYILIGFETVVTLLQWNASKSSSKRICYIRWPAWSWKKKVSSLYSEYVDLIHWIDDWIITLKIEF